VRGVEGWGGGVGEREAGAVGAEGGGDTEEGDNYVHEMGRR